MSRSVNLSFLCARRRPVVVYRRYFSCEEHGAARAHLSLTGRSMFYFESKRFHLQCLRAENTVFSIAIRDARELTIAFSDFVQPPRENPPTFPVSKIILPNELSRSSNSSYLPSRGSIESRAYEMEKKVCIFKRNYINIYAFAAARNKTLSG